MADPISPVNPTFTRTQPSGDERLRAVARDLEASFLAEMLKAAKFGEPRRAFGGGAGEEQFASFFRNEVAKDMAGAGGIGLAENLFNALKAKEADNGSR